MLEYIEEKNVIEITNCYFSNSNQGQLEKKRNLNDNYWNN